jgi:hypothetical protein
VVTGGGRRQLNPRAWVDAARSREFPVIEGELLQLFGREEALLIGGTLNNPEIEMYAAFAGQRTVTRTQTNVRIFLGDPKGSDAKITRVISVILDGTMEVFTQQQFFTTLPLLDTDETSRGEMAVLPWTVGDMPSSGESEIGTIKMRGNPTMMTTGVITQNAPGLAFPATLIASVFQVLDIPGYGTLHNKYPVMITGTVDKVPPYHLLAACRCSMLVDDQNNVRGLIGGRSLTLLGPA